MAAEITFPDYIHNAGVGGLRGRIAASQVSPPVATTSQMIFPIKFKSL